MDTDLNKACPKDNFPLPELDRLVDSMAGHALLSFMDVYYGFHQIPMWSEDQDKTSFITEKGLYGWLRMPFDLRNAPATFQRLINTVFKPRLGRNMEDYMDDMIVISWQEQGHIGDLRETFEILRKFKLKLNPKKYVFEMKDLGVARKNLGMEFYRERVSEEVFLVTERLHWENIVKIWHVNSKIYRYSKCFQ